MAKKQTRKTISVSRTGYVASMEIANARGISLSSVVEQLLIRWRNGEVEVEASAAQQRPAQVSQ